MRLHFLPIQNTNCRIPLASLPSRSFSLPQVFSALPSRSRSTRVLTTSMQRAIVRAPQSRRTAKGCRIRRAPCVSANHYHAKAREYKGLGGESKAAWRRGVAPLPCRSPPDLICFHLLGPCVGLGTAIFETAMIQSSHTASALFPLPSFTYVSAIFY